MDLTLPDGAGTDAIDLFSKRGIPSIVFTADYRDDVRTALWQKRVIDYIVKEDARSISYLTSLVRRIRRNSKVKALVVDDSPTTRKHICELLRTHRYQILEAADGVEALALLTEHPDTVLVITDYQMPNMDGFELTSQIRQRAGKDELTVIGTSSSEDPLSARFLKCGASDFILRPFEAEEFYCRVTQNVELLETIKENRELAMRDQLTGLHNRRYLFHTGAKLIACARRKHLTVTAAMLDIDNFKRINDTYGHDGGDAALVELASILKRRFRESDVVARFGGEEFCLLTTNMDPDACQRVFDEVRESIAGARMEHGGESISMTVSVGVCIQQLPSLEDMIKHADRMLYRAKEAGRNRVVVER